MLLKHFQKQKNIFVNNIGLGKRKQQAYLYVDEKSSGTNSFVNHKNNFAKKNQLKLESCELNTVDSYCKRKNINYIDFLKIDVEGYEYQVLLGADKTIKKRKIGCIQFEYGGTYLSSRVYLKDIWIFLRKYKYKIGKLLPHRIDWKKDYSGSFENYQLSNWLACRTKNHGI